MRQQQILKPNDNDSFCTISVIISIQKVAGWIEIDFLIFESTPSTAPVIRPVATLEVFDRYMFEVTRK